jgi:hypothetical protein
MSETTTSHERFIAVSGDGLFGHYGCDKIMAVAKRKLREAGGRIAGCRVCRFTATIPFAPVGRDAYDTEADCWVNPDDGSISSIRCEREWLTE